MKLNEKKIIVLIFDACWWTDCTADRLCQYKPFKPDWNQPVFSCFRLKYYTIRDNKLIKDKMARTAASVNVSPKSMRRVSTSRSSTPSRSAPPKKVAKMATPIKPIIISDRLNPRVLLSKSLEIPSGVKVNEIPVNKVRKSAPKSSGPKSKFLSMVSGCIFKLKDRNGSSRAAILNQLKLDYSAEIGSNEANIHTNLKMALKKGLAEGVLKMAKETGKGSGSFKLGEHELKRLKAKAGISKTGSSNDAKNGNEEKKIMNDNTLEKS